MRLLTARRPLAAVAIAAAAAAIAGPVVIASPAQAAVTQAYFTANSGGTVQPFVVPPAVSRIFVSAIGGSGGPGASRNSFSGGSGGAAGSVTAALAVTPGETLNIYIGYAGAAATSISPGAGGSSSYLSVAGPFVYGGNGGGGDQAVLGAGGGGGGTTVITDGPTPLLAAGGGGGGGGAEATAAGGAGGAGGNPAGNGQAGDGPVPGAGGRGAQTGLGVPGQAGQDRLDLAAGGGGGGAGWNVPGGQTGGGAGGKSSNGNTFGNGGGGGGGAGASSAVATATNVHYSTARGFGNGSLFISWDQPPTTTTLQGTGFSRVGQPATFTAVVGPGAPVAGEPVGTGTVSFDDGLTFLGNAPLRLNAAGQDVAVFSTSTLAPGLHSITASYNGDIVYAGSTSDPLTQEVAAPYVFTSKATLPGVVGVPLSFTVRTTGFPPPLLLAQGKLDGLTLTDHGDGTATLTGTPVAAGTFPITLSAASIVNAVVQQTLTFTVTLNPLSVTTSTLPPAFVGQAYSATLTRQGGTPPYTWSLASGQLPKGITLNATTGVLSGTPTAAGTTNFTAKATDSTSPTRRTATKALRLTANGIVPAVYVANGANNSVTSYPLATGNLPPSTRLAGIGQGLNGPGGLVINAAGRVFVTDSGSDAITEYDRGATTPTVTVAGSNTGLAGPAGITLDTGGLIYVANRAANSVSVFDGGANGNVAPFFTIAGPDTGLSSPAAVAIDAAGHLWVANASANTLTAYLAGSSGDAKPFARVAGPATGLNEPQGLAVDANDNLLAVNTFGESVTTYPLPSIGPATNPNVTPIRTISGSSTGLSFPDGIDIDSSGRIYVTNQFDNDITSYPATAIGNVAPLATIAGGNTGLAGPSAIAITPPLLVLTHTLPLARLGHAYRLGLQAAQGTSPYVWTLSRGSLPPGLWLQPDGTIAGTPRRIGHWTFTVRVTDTSHPHAEATQSLTLKVTAR